MRKLYGVSWALAVVVIAALFASASAASAAVVTIHVAWPSEQEAGMADVVADFNQTHTTIQAQATYTPTATLPTLLATELQAGNPPDVFQANLANSNIASIYPLAAKGKLLNLTGQPWVKATPKFAKPLLTVKGKVYGAIPTADLNEIIYNRTVLSSLSVKPPATYSALLAYCAKAKAAGKIPIALAGATSTFPALLLVDVGTSFVFSKDPNWVTQRDHHKVTFASSPLWQAVGNATVQMNKDGCFGPSATGTTISSALGEVATGQAGMLIGVTAFYGALKMINPSASLGLLAFPGQSARYTAASVGVSPLAVSASTSNPAAVKTFLDFVEEPQQETVLANALGNITPGALTHDALPAWMSTIAPVVKAGKLVDTFDDFFPNQTTFFGTMVPDYTGLLTGQKTVSEFLHDTDAAW